MEDQESIPINEIYIPFLVMKSFLSPPRSPLPEPNLQ